MARKDSSWVGFGPFRFDLETYALTKNQEPMKIQHHLALILHCLIQNRPNVVRCIDPGLSELFSAMGDNTEQKHRNFTKYMSALRSTLGRSEFDKSVVTH